MNNKLLKKIFFLVVITILLSIRLQKGYIFQNILDGKYLWAEDGNIFFNESIKLGFNSIINPYHGYLHLYPRIIALFANFFDLAYLPILYFIGSVLPIFIMIFYIYKFYETFNIKYFFILFVSSLTIILPVSGIVFFNITNVQWILSIILYLIIFDRNYNLISSKNIQITNLIFLILLCLTGPFSIFFSFIIIIKIIFEKIFGFFYYDKNEMIKYFIIFICSLIQIVYLLKSGRILHGYMDKNIINWINNIITFISFGSKNKYKILSILLWILMLYNIIKSYVFLKTYKLNDLCSVDSYKILCGIIIFISAIILYFPGLWNCANHISQMRPQGSGERYFFIPYMLFLLAIPLMIRNTKIMIFSLVIFSVISINRFTNFKAENLYFQSWCLFSKKVNEVYIPIQPQLAAFPGWHIYYGRNFINKIDHGENINYVKYNLTNIKFINYSMDEFRGTLHGDKNSYFIIKIPNYYIETSEHFGVEILLDKSKDGWVFIKAYDLFDNLQINIKRFYNKGYAKIQFAFPNRNLSYIKVIPSEEDESIKLKKFLLYLL